jgi:hypothetical protein
LNNNGNGEPETYIPYLHNTDQVQACIHNAISHFTPAAKSLFASAAKKLGTATTTAAQLEVLKDLHLLSITLTFSIEL